MKENIRLNRVFDKVVPMLGDAKEVVGSLRGVADMVLMPLPEKALEYLHYAVKTLKPSGGWIHFHDFEHAPQRAEAIEKTKQKVQGALAGLDFSFGYSRLLRSTGPNWYQVVLDIWVNDLASKF
jgi:tRNA (guanine37-N1)-methyltransferase